MQKEESKMKKIIILIALLLLTGCSGKPADIADTPVEKVEIPAASGGEEETENIKEPEKENEEFTDEEVIAAIDMSLNPNELGEIMILMYHGHIEFMRTGRYHL